MKEIFHPQDPAGPEAPLGNDIKEIGKKYLVNKLNFIDFNDGTIQACFRHKKSNHRLRLDLKLRTCLNEHAECGWVSAEGAQQLLSSYVFEHFIIPDHPKSLIVKSDQIYIGEQGIRWRIPEACIQIDAPGANRLQCRNIKVQLIQSGSMFIGTLIDFSAVSFRAEITAIPPQTFSWLNIDSPINVMIFDGQELLYSGECQIIEQKSSDLTRQYVLEPASKHIQRFAPRKHRSIRQILAPAPDIKLIHPITRQYMVLKIMDLSGAGFSVKEEEATDSLLPGMVIPQLEMCIAGGLNIQCRAQVVYRKAINPEGKERSTKCGLAVLDIHEEDHKKLMALLNLAKDEKSYICSEVDMDDLWDFFFETGFIYPEKYEYIRTHKDQIRDTFRKLYSQNPSFFRYFVLREKNRILAHISMLRFYRKAWLIHHHAARTSESHRAGLTVLNQIGRFGYESHRLYSLHMDYLFCYFRPNNKFPNLVFGGATKQINNPKKCSIDTFSYFRYQATDAQGISPFQVVKLIQTRREDLLILENKYAEESGGLMVDALDLEPDMLEWKELSEEYRRFGLKRERVLYSLVMGDALKAIIVVNLSDIGLNLSDLTHCIQMVFTDTEDVNKEIVHLALSMLCDKIEQKEMAVMIYPSAFAQRLSFPDEKLYNLWILNILQSSDEYFNYVNRLVHPS